MLHSYFSLWIYEGIWGELFFFPTLPLPCSEWWLCRAGCKMSREQTVHKWNCLQESSWSTAKCSDGGSSQGGQAVKQVHGYLKSCLCSVCTSLAARYGLSGNIFSRNISESWAHPQCACQSPTALCLSWWFLLCCTGEKKPESVLGTTHKLIKSHI